MENLETLEIRVHSNDTVKELKSRKMMRIQEFAKLCNCKAYTLRYYDEIGLLKPCAILSDSRYRYYQEEQVYEYQWIRALQEIGFTTRELVEYNQKNPIEKQQWIEEKIHLLNQKIQLAEQLKIRVGSQEPQ